MATPHVNLDERAKKTGIDPTARDVIVDDGDPNRVFSIRFKSYLDPSDFDSLDETKRVDTENEERYQFNSQQLPLLNILLARMKANWKLPKAPVYYEPAFNRWKTKINEPAFRTVEAVKFLAARRLYAIQDYPIDEAAKRADDIVVAEFLTAQQAKPPTTRIPIHDVDGVPKDHHQFCDCNYTWDGRSQYCTGRDPTKRLRMTWRTQHDHHFLRPLFEPCSF